MLTSAVDFLSDDSLPPELRTISVKLSDFRQQFDSITGQSGIYITGVILLLLPPPSPTAATALSSEKKHGRFLLYLSGKCLDLHNIFRVCL